MSANRFTSSDRAIVAGRQVALSNEVIRVGRPHDESEESPSSHGEPKLELIRLGDRIQAIDVVCPCGQRTRIRCVYE